MCRSLPGRELGQVCANCEGRCILCDSQSLLQTMVRICDECSHPTVKDQCVVCHSHAVSAAQYCDSCVELEYDRDGCPRVTKSPSQKVAAHFNRNPQKR
jgi:PHD finger-like domain-containing protein 5A